MDALAGYGSDDDVSDEEPSQLPVRASAPTEPAAAPEPSSSAKRGFLGSLPSPRFAGSAAGPAAPSPWSAGEADAQGSVFADSRAGSSAKAGATADGEPSEKLTDSLVASRPRSGLFAALPPPRLAQGSTLGLGVGVGLGPFGETRDDPLTSAKLGGRIGGGAGGSGGGGGTGGRGGGVGAAGGGKKVVKLQLPVGSSLFSFSGQGRGSAGGSGSAGAGGGAGAAGADYGEDSESDEEERARKTRIRERNAAAAAAAAGGGKRGLAAFLPAPRNSLGMGGAMGGSGSTRLDLTGGGGGGRGGGGGGGGEGVGAGGGSGKVESNRVVGGERAGELRTAGAAAGLGAAMGGVGGVGPRLGVTDSDSDESSESGDEEGLGGVGMEGAGVMGGMGGGDGDTEAGAGERRVYSHPATERANELQHSWGGAYSEGHYSEGYSASATAVPAQGYYQPEQNHTGAAAAAAGTEAVHPGAYTQAYPDSSDPSAHSHAHGYGYGYGYDSNATAANSAGQGGGMGEYSTAALVAGVPEGGLGQAGGHTLGAEGEDTEALARMARKRGRGREAMEVAAAAANVVEVKQADLTKGRVRQDPMRATGTAFGPAYAPVSAGGNKPSKMHRRKHQIGSLYFDMRQKETELVERRSKGMLSKAETHAKYGW
ncbi:unnamed protein product [Closterium sp. NIES-65]|nr:unnamed protein product [Closterium sp. NIES-65]